MLKTYGKGQKGNNAEVFQGHDAERSRKYAWRVAGAGVAHRKQNNGKFQKGFNGLISKHRFNAPPTTTSAARF